jgi:stress response protein YsnF
VTTPVDPGAESHPAEPVEMTRHEEQLHVGVTRFPYRTVRVRRRIITEVRRIEVEVRTEVLDIDWVDVDPSAPPDDMAGPERLELILHGEEPEVRLVTIAKERIILHRDNVPGTAEVRAAVRSERIAVEPGGQAD